VDHQTGRQESPLPLTSGEKIRGNTAVSMDPSRISYGEGGSESQEVRRELYKKKVRETTEGEEEIAGLHVETFLRVRGREARGGKIVLSGDPPLPELYRVKLRTHPRQRSGERANWMNNRKQRITGGVLKGGRFFLEKRAIDEDPQREIRWRIQKESGGIKRGRIAQTSVSPSREQHQTSRGSLTRDGRRPWHKRREAAREGRGGGEWVNGT